MLELKWIPDVELYQIYGEFWINLDEQELIFLIDYSSCSSLFTQVNQPTWLQDDSATQLIMKEQRKRWIREEK